MPAYIIIKAQDGFDPDDPMTYLAGYPIDVHGRSALYGRIIPPKYVQVEITDEDDYEAVKATYCGEWRRLIDWEFVGHDYAIDGHRLRVWMKPEVVSVSGLNSLTRAQVETWLNNWGCTVQSIAANEVVFDAIVFNCLKSKGFWNYNVSAVTFVEKAYNKTTGIHQVEARYGTSLSVAAVESAITSKGGVVVSRATGKITFEINRTAVFDEFKIDLKQAVESASFSRRRFKVLPQHIQMAIDAGGTLSVTKQQWAQYVYNRLND